MSWLAIPFKWFLEWVLEKVLALISLYQKDKANHEDAVKEAKEQVAPIKAVKEKPDATEEEIDKAIDDASRRF